MRGPLSPAFSVFVCALVVSQTGEADLPENSCQDQAIERLPKRYFQPSFIIEDRIYRLFFTLNCNVQ